MLIKTRLSFILIIGLGILCFSTPVWSQKRQQSIKIPLKIEPKTHGSSLRSIFDEPMKLSENEKSGKTLNDSLITVRRDKNDSAKFYVLIDTDSDGNLTNENKVLLLNNEKITIEVRKSKNAPVIPFELSVAQNEKGAIFWWKTNIQAIGLINVKNCSSAIYLQDLNADGIFGIWSRERICKLIEIMTEKSGARKNGFTAMKLLIFAVKTFWFQVSRRMEVFL
jgi:hypothetical protein